MKLETMVVQNSGAGGGGGDKKGGIMGHWKVVNRTHDPKKRRIEI